MCTITLFSKLSNSQIEFVWIFFIEDKIYFYNFFHFQIFKNPCNIGCTVMRGKWVHVILFNTNSKQIKNTIINIKNLLNSLTTLIEIYKVFTGLNIYI
jgi:hypothetical protein